MQSINENLFNRFLTKNEIEQINGLIGASSTVNSIPQIKEADEFSQKHQLQPVAHSKIGTVDWFMSFEDFLQKISRLGVNTDKFNEWGASLQFNWIPPIDIDKLINYQDYYWDSDTFDDAPQYVTVKNQKNWAAARFRQIQKAITDVAPTYIISSVNTSSQIISIAGNIVANFTIGEKLVSYDNNGNYYSFTIGSVVFNTSSLKTDITVLENQVTTQLSTISKTFIPIQKSIIGTNQIVVDGNMRVLFTEGYIFSTINSLTQPTTYWKVVSSEYSTTDLTTTITVSHDVTNTFDWKQLSIFPVASLANAEINLLLGVSSIDPITTWHDSDVGNLIWYKDYNIVESRSTGFTTFPLNTFNDSSVNFITLTVLPNDIIIASYNNGTTHEYTIHQVATNTLTISNVEFFTRSAINYKIVRQIPFNSLIISTAPSAPVLNQLWIDNVNDNLNQWNGSTWVTKQSRVSILYTSVNERNQIDIIQMDPWSIENKWTHRNEITNFTGKTRAQIPIIEYYPYLEFSDTSFSSKQWKYRKDSQSSYSQSLVQPTLFELLDINLQSILDPDFIFQSASLIILSEKYGNLTQSINVGDFIVLNGFAENNGTYKVQLVEFIQMTPLSRFITRIHLETPVINPLDFPQGSTIRPKYTSNGDLFLGINVAHWFFEGITNVAASSIKPSPNPMLSIFVDFTSDNTNNFDTLVGLVWQEFKFNITKSVPGMQYTFDSSLHDLVLYDDYQEGDIRVYIDGIRQYGNFSEFRSIINLDYVGSIQFDDTVIITDKNIIRFEMGEYALTDIGKRAVNILMASGNQLFNLVDIRKIEQQKTDTTQYPEFCLYDVNGIALTNASSIFTFEESADSPIDLNTLRRIVYDSTIKDYSFLQLLVNNEQLLLYKDFLQVGNELQSIWKKGLNNEQYVPQKLNSGQWELPNQWYYNIGHDNKVNISLTELFTHFKTIIDAQKTPSVFSTIGTSLYYLDDNVNYGVGGTIKEHNNGLDLLISSLFVNNVNPVSLIQFAHDQYKNNIKSIEDKFQKDAVNLLTYNTDINNITDLISYITTTIKAWFETNDKYNQWFGDSTTYNSTTQVGIKNWIATIPYLSLGPKYSPYIIQDNQLKITELYHHDGHRTNISYSLAVKNLIYKKLKATTTVGEQTISSSSDAFPTSINGITIKNGNYLLRKSVTDTILYRFSIEGAWELVNLDSIIAQVLLSFEQELFDNLPTNAGVSNFSPVYDVNVNKTNDDYGLLTRQQFSFYVKDNNILTPFSSINIFKSTNAFTWNYAYTSVPIHPSTGIEFTNVSATWQALYKTIYGTSYPHREPWVLQGYVEKPEWWDNFYRDSSNVRYWQSNMWNNIFSGVIPLNKQTPSGTTGSGMLGQILTLFDFLSVNVDNSPTIDGILPDGLLPPFWDTKNTNNNKVKSLYDPSQQQFIITPQANYLFGQNGPFEWKWNISSQRFYDDLIVSFKLDPMKFMYFTFGTEFKNVNCLQVDKKLQKVFAHNDTVFHGDFIADTNTIFVSNGLNQWYVHYNRYNELNDVNSGFKPLWVDWQVKLSYLFNSFIDTSNFNVSNDIFDLTNTDFNILVKKTQGINDIWLDSLTATILNIPSKYTLNRDSSNEWVVQFGNTSPVSRSLFFYAPENYDFKVVPKTNSPFTGDTFRVYSYNIINAGVQNKFAYRIISYNQTLEGFSSTQLLDNNFEYWFSANVDNAGSISYAIKGKDAQTFNELITQLNIKLNGLATASIKNGDIVIQSNTFGNSSSISLIDNGLFVSANSNLFNNISSQIFSSIEFLNYFIINGNKVNIFNIGDNVIVSNSTNFNGTYPITDIKYDIVNAQTIITVNANVTISNLTVDGIIEPSNSKTLPATWHSGTQIYLNTDGILPSGLNNTNPYYIIILNDREFKLTNSQANATNNVPIIVQSAGSGDNYVGRVQSTFTALGGKTTSAAWKRHYSDKRYIENIPPPFIISGIQYMVDFLKGYDDYSIDIGFELQNSAGENVDPDTGRNNSWSLETEKFIDTIYNLANIRTANVEKFQITPVSHGNYFILNNGFTANWQLGTEITLNAGAKSQLPLEFNNPLISFVPYFIIPGIQKNRFQLALSLNDANKGNAILFSDDGTGDIFLSIVQAASTFPTIQLNPFKSYIWINNDIGVLSNVFAGKKVDVLTNQIIYDNNGNDLTNKELIILREDKQTRISLILSQQATNTATPIESKYIQGMHLFFDGYEHIITFENIAADGSLIYDPFLGLNSPRFYLNFNKQLTKTLRPNVGGFILQNNQLVSNFESSVDNLRYAYDTYNEVQDPKITQAVNQSLGYSGTKDYMNSLKINPKSQFIFWRGMIKQKGSNVSVNAFLNQNVFGDITVDEFWAYKLATFGDSKPKNYLEMKLQSGDVNNKELRLEFVLPDSTSLDDTFIPIRLTDLSRWWNQPDQFAKMQPIDTFYFDVTTVAIIKNAETKIVSVDGKHILPLNSIGNNVIISYFDNDTFTTKYLSENKDFTYLNSSVINFSDIIFSLTNVTVYVVTYNYDAQSPAFIFDKLSNATVANVPIWNPALHQYYHNAIGIVDLKTGVDPAQYTTPISGNLAKDFWNTPDTNKVWLDDSIEGYFPYYDPQVYPDINDRLSKWGVLADWADVKMYQWTESIIPPTEWAAAVLQDANDASIIQQNKRTGQVYKVLYKNIGTQNSPIWEVQKDQHYEIIAGLISTASITLNFSNSVANVVNIYINGAFVEALNLGLAPDCDSNLINYILAQPLQNYIHVVLPAHIPTQTEIDNVLYKFDTPYSVITKIDKNTTEQTNLYYFWITNKINKRPFQNQITIFEAEKLFKNMNAPYMIVTGFRGTDFGYGLIYGAVFDEDAFDVPYRYSQAIVRGLAGLITDDDRYSLTFTRDFTLRDKLPTGKSLNDVHTEWKLFREKQLSKVDEYLWDKLVEALIGVTVKDRIATAIAVPSLDRILYDDLYNTSTKYGLGNDQIFTDPTLSLQTILKILQSSNVAFGNIDINQFLQQHTFGTPSDILTAMYEIYDNFPIDTVNYIYFQILYDALSLQKDYNDFLKTSWVSIEISQNITPSMNVPLNSYKLLENGTCFLSQT